MSIMSFLVIFSFTILTPSVELECTYGNLLWHVEAGMAEFSPRAETKATVFEYIWIFYNHQRIHSTNDYETPEEYYAARENLGKTVA